MVNGGLTTKPRCCRRPSPSRPTPSCCSRTRSRFLARVSVEQPGAAAASICRAARGRGLFEGSRIAPYGVRPAPTSLLLHLRAMSPAVRMRGIRRIGIGTAGIGEERIPIAIAAPAGGHILALGQGIKAAGHDGGSHVLAAILGSRRRRRDGHEGQRAYYG